MPYNKQSLETRRKNGWFKDLEKTKEKMREAYVKNGNKPPSAKGIKWTEERKLAARLLRLGKPRPAHVIEAMSKTWFKKGCVSLNKGKDGLKNELNPAWKGDNVGYISLHKWVYRHRGSPKKCEHCLSEEKKNYHWANKSHEYKRDLDDWIRLCVSCHKKYDLKFINNV